MLSLLDGGEQAMEQARRAQEFIAAQAPPNSL
jgi:hypothetical protein